METSQSQIDRQSFLKHAGKLSLLSYFAALTGCAGGISQLLPSSKSRGGVNRRTASSSYNAGGRVITSNYDGAHTVTLTCTDQNGQNPQTIVTITGDASTGLITYSALGQQTFTINANSYAASGGAVSAFGHTISPTSVWGASVGNASITGPVVSNGSAEHDIPNATAYGTSNGYSASTATIVEAKTGGGGGTICTTKTICGNATTSGGNTNATLHAVLAGIGFLGGLTALVIAAPEITMAIAVISTVAIMADFIEFLNAVCDL